MRQRTTTFTMCDGCGREGAVTDKPPKWITICGGTWRACVCSPACGAKVLTARRVAREAASASTRDVRRGEGGR